jgi:hypothetical protein
MSSSRVAVGLNCGVSFLIAKGALGVESRDAKASVCLGSKRSVGTALAFVVNKRAKKKAVDFILSKECRTKFES